MSPVKKQVYFFSIRLFFAERTQKSPNRKLGDWNSAVFHHQVAENLRVYAAGARVSCWMVSTGAVSSAANFSGLWARS